jgi:adenylate kinase
VEAVEATGVAVKGEWDDELDTAILNEDAYLDALDEIEADRGTRGGLVVDYHSSEMFPERLFDLVVVLRTRNDVLFDRLSAREYSERKIRENIDAEILRVCIDEALESYDESIVHELPSNTVDEMDEAIDYVMDQIAAYQRRQQAAAAVQ